MKTLMTLDGMSGNWEIAFSAGEGAGGTLVQIDADDRPVLAVSRDDGGLKAVIHTVWHGETERFGRDPAFEFALTAPEGGEEVRLCWYGYAFRLYVDGALQDEEWPLGDLPAGRWTVRAAETVRNLSCAPADAVEPDPEAQFEGPFQNFVLPGHNTGVGDCMPFARDGRYCLYYLFDRRGHASKKGLGAHQWAQVSSADLRTWTVHPMAVGITEQWEGSICTGSLIQKEGRTYAFYAVRTSDGSPAQLTWAVSDDGVHFVKSGRNFALTAPYEPVSARDPMVFCDAGGLYHMLVTTSLADGGPYGGCLAHLTSANLEDWTQHPPFIVPGYADQPECSDYFEWNGWYYLVFSNFATASYRMSRQPFGPWIRPEADELDALEVQVPKTAPFGNRRFSTGFLARRPRTYAGNAVTHELYQREDGTLGVKQLEEILPHSDPVACPAGWELAAGDGRTARALPAVPHGFRLKARMIPDRPGALMGLCIVVDGREYRIEMNPAARTVTIIRPGESFSYGSGRDLLRGVSFDGGIAFDLIVQGDILDMILSSGRAITMRLDHSADGGAQPILYALAGTALVSEIEYSEIR